MRPPEVSVLAGAEQSVSPVAGLVPTNGVCERISGFLCRYPLSR